MGFCLGAFALCSVLDKPFKKSLGIITIVFCCIFVFLRIIATGFYIFDLVNTVQLLEAPLTMDIVLSVIEYFAFIPLFVSFIFLFVYVLKGKMKKITQILSGISLITMIVIWGIYIFNIVSSGMEQDFSFIQIFINIYNAGLVWKLFIISGYSMVFGGLTGAMEKKL